MHWKEHVADCERILGKGWDVVHRWLDDYAGNYWPSKMHRALRHHKEGVEEVRKKWGDEAAKAAEIHIRVDLGCDKIPTEEEVNKLYAVD